MSKPLLLFLLLTAVLIAALTIARSPRTLSESTMSTGDAPTPDDSRAPVLVELFTSEGCSSCPPADELLAQLERTQPVAGAEIIALSEHVDYWNRLGWADPYSSSEFSARQNDYAKAFDTDDIYTPQMIVDGRVQFVGSNQSRAREAIAEAARAAKTAVQVSLRNTTANSVDFAVRVAEMRNAWSGDSSEVFLAITESGLSSHVSRGENAGRRLNHTAVVRKLVKLGEVDPQTRGFDSEKAVTIEKQWKRGDIKLVVFVQERASRRVLGAAAVSLK